MKKDTKLKVDFNLLTSGTWVLEKKGRQRVYRFEKRVGDGKVIIYNALDVPSVLDSKILDYLMLKSQGQQWSKEVTVESLRKFAKDVGLGTGKQKVERIRKALEILVNTRIKFENCFIDSGTLDYISEGNYEVVNIGILSDYVIEKVKARGKPRRVSVWFNDNFLALCKHSLGYKLIPFAPIKGLRDTAYALYKWAWRWFNNEKGYGERWIGDGKKLVEWYKNELNSTAKYRYPSKVLERISSAMEQLNESDRVPFHFQLKQENGSYRIEIRRKEGVPLLLRREIPFDTLPKILKEAVIKLIERKKHVKDPYALARSLSEKELETYTKKLETATVSREVYELLADLEKAYGGKLGILSSQESGGRVQIAFERENSTLKKWLDAVRSEENAVV